MGAMHVILQSLFHYELVTENVSANFFNIKSDWVHRMQLCKKMIFLVSVIIIIVSFFLI